MLITFKLYNYYLLIQKLFKVVNAITYFLLLLINEFQQINKEYKEKKFIKEILINKIPNIRNVGRSGSIVHSELLEKIGGADNDIYTQNLSLSLRCAKFSKFSYVDSYIATIADRSINLDKKFSKIM